MINVDNNKKFLSSHESNGIINILKERFEKNMDRHVSCDWKQLQLRFYENPEKLWSINQMEITGGEPDVIGYDKKTNKYIFCDCSSESPKGRRSLCYDRKALDTRKEHKPENSAIDMAFAMGVELLNEEQYLELHKLGTFDTKTSSWLKTPPAIRNLGGAIFGDLRYGRVFVYHNGADSYYSARGFRALINL